MIEQLESAVDQALEDGFRGLWASGDMTWEFGPEKDFTKLLDYELRLEELINRRKELCGICQYHQDNLPPEIMRQGLLVHSSIVINETLSRINPHYIKSSETAHGFNKSSKLDETIAALCGGI